MMFTRNCLTFVPILNIIFLLANSCFGWVPLRRMLKKYPSFIYKRYSYSGITILHWYPSKLSLWAATHFSLRYYHCWKQQWFTSSFKMVFSWFVAFGIISSLGCNMVLFRSLFSLGKIQKSHVAMSGEYGAWRSTGLLCLAKKLCIKCEEWLSW